MKNTFKTVLTALIIFQTSILSYGQIIETRSFKTGQNDSLAFMQVVKWAEYRGQTSNQPIEYANDQTRELKFSGEIPLTYRFAGRERDGGIVSYSAKISIKKGLCTYTLVKADHSSTNSTGHKSGGYLFVDSPPKGKGIFKKTWLSYQEQTKNKLREIISTLEEQLAVK